MSKSKGKAFALATDEGVRGKARAAFATLQGEKQGLDVLERCKKLNEFLAQDFSSKGSVPRADAKAQLDHILGLLSSKPKRPACLDTPLVLANGAGNPAQHTQPTSAKAHSSLASTAASSRQAIIGMSHMEADSLLSLIQEADTHFTPQGGGCSSSGCTPISSVSSGSRPNSCLSEKAGAVPSQHPFPPDDGLDDLVSLFNPTATSIAPLQGPLPTATQATRDAEKQQSTRQALAASEKQQQAAADLEAKRQQEQKAEQERQAGAEAKLKAAKLAAEAKVAKQADADAHAARLRAESEAQVARLKARVEATKLRAEADATQKRAREEADSQRAKAAKQIAARTAAVITLQRHWRSWQKRCKAAEKQRVDREAAATQLQRAVRCWAARKELAGERIVARARATVAARRVQRAWRAWHAHRGWKLGELRVPVQRSLSVRSSAGAVHGSTVGAQLLVAKPLRVVSALGGQTPAPATGAKPYGPSRNARQQTDGKDRRAEPVQPPVQAQAQRALSATRSRCLAVEAEEVCKRSDLGARVLMVASENRTLSQALAVSVARATTQLQSSFGLPPRG